MTTKSTLQHLLASLLLCAAMAPFAEAQDLKDALGDGKAKDIRPQDVIKWDAIEATVVDGMVRVGARLTPAQGWTIYEKNLEFAAEGFKVDKVEGPLTKTIVDPITGKDTDVFDGGEFFVTFDGVIDPNRDTFQFSAKYVGCTQVICLFPYTDKMFAPFVGGAPGLQEPPATASAPAPQSPTPAIVTAPSTTDPATAVSATAGEADLETKLAQMLGAGGTSFMMLLLIAFAGGVLSNLTPCVYPMIPITLRLLARQGSSPYASASFYAAGIVVTYSILGLVAALSGGMFGALMASKAFNGTFAVVMLALGTTMLGFGDLSKLQMLGSKLGSGQASPGNTFLMGAGAGLVAAPCTGPILATLLAFIAKAQQGIGPSTLLLTVYSVGFAAPYVALGGAAGKVSAVKVPPHVQIGVKLLFAAVMYALAFYYLRIPFYGLLKQAAPFWTEIMAAGLVVGGLLSLVWLLVPRLQNSKGSMILPTVILGIGLFGLSQKLTARDPNAVVNVTWHKDEAAAIKLSKETGKPILIDMWAEWCEACKKMDVTTFVDPKVTQTLADGWIALKLDLTETDAASEAIQKKYKIPSLPTLVLLPPGGDLAGQKSIVGYVNGAGLVNNLTEFTGKAE